jgi:hypothetical protein
VNCLTFIVGLGDAQVYRLSTDGAEWESRPNHQITSAPEHMVAQAVPNQLWICLYFGGCAANSLGVALSLGLATRAEILLSEDRDFHTVFPVWNPLGTLQP